MSDPKMKTVSVDIEQLREYSARQMRDAETIVNLCDAAGQLSAKCAALEKELKALKESPVPAK